jgi:hypothetical protein
MDRRFAGQALAQAELFLFLIVRKHRNDFRVEKSSRGQQVQISGCTATYDYVRTPSVFD